METDANIPKKYIRTLAGDMATLKKGGTPDLAPLIGKKEMAQRQATPAPEHPTPIETYASDFSDRVKDTHASPATVLAAEQDAAPSPSEPAPAHSHGVLYVFAGVMLLAAGGAGAYYAYTRYSTSTAPTILAPVVSSPIFVDDREQISGTGVTLLQAVEQSAGSPLAAGAVRLLYTEGATTTDNSVFSALQLPAPDVLLRNLNASGSMAGIVNVGGSQSPFFILSVASYGDTFSGMLSWEPTMPRGLASLFPAYPVPVAPVIAPIATSTIATTTLATTTPKITPTITLTFHDEVINDHDVRVYRDAQGRSVLLYGYWDQQTLVIARDEAAFTEILQRLATSHAQS